jgi:hypothetical protein
MPHSANDIDELEEELLSKSESRNVISGQNYQ